MHRRSIALLSPRIALCTLLLVTLLNAPIIRTARGIGGEGHVVLTAGGPTLPDRLMSRVNASLLADDPAYAIASLPNDATMLHATNPAHHLTTTFAPDGITFTGEDGAHWDLRLSAVGVDAVTRVVAPVMVGGRVEYRRENLTEWYLNGPLGVEQGFTLAAPPTPGDGYTLTLAVRGAPLRLDADAVTLIMPGGEELGYGHLLITDAAGRQLPARLSIADDSIVITTDLTGAVYPVTVDPLIEQRLTASDGAAADYFGTSVAMSNDGTHVIVGAFYKNVGANTLQGAAYVYSGANYATEKRLVPSDGAGSDYFGYSVAMSSDGMTVIVGAYNKTVSTGCICFGQGAAYIYSGANYATERKLAASDRVGGDEFGYSVAMSDNGTTVIVGAINKKTGVNNRQGGAYVYSGVNYATETKLIASDGAAFDNFGYSVAMSSDGTKVIVGAYFRSIGVNNQQGVAYVYSGTNYATEKELVASDGGNQDYFGYSVAMSSDGTTVIVGAEAKTITIGANSHQGAAYVYGGTNYATENRLTASDGASFDYFGHSVAISSDGTTVIVGAYHKNLSGNAQQGAAYVYKFLVETELLSSDGTAGDGFGFSVAMSSGGATVVVGAPYKKIGMNTNQGAAYVYGAPIVGPPPTPAPLPPPKPGGGSSSEPNPLPVPKSGGGSGATPNPLPQARP